MSTAKKVPTEVVARAAAVTKRYTVGTPKTPAPAPAPKRKLAKDKVVAALKRLHPMD